MNPNQSEYFPPSSNADPAGSASEEEDSSPRKRINCLIRVEAHEALMAMSGGTRHMGEWLSDAILWRQQYGDIALSLAELEVIKDTLQIFFEQYYTSTSPAD